MTLLCKEHSSIDPVFRQFTLTLSQVGSSRLSSGLWQCECRELGTDQLALVCVGKSRAGVWQFNRMYITLAVNVFFPPNIPFSDLARLFPKSPWNRSLRLTRTQLWASPRTVLPLWSVLAPHSEPFSHISVLKYSCHAVKPCRARLPAEGVDLKMWGPCKRGLSSGSSRDSSNSCGSSYVTHYINLSITASCCFVELLASSNTEAHWHVYGRL